MERKKKEKGMRVGREEEREGRDEGKGGMKGKEG